MYLPWREIHCEIENSHTIWIHEQIYKKKVSRYSSRNPAILLGWYSYAVSFWRHKFTTRHTSQRRVPALNNLSAFIIIPVFSFKRILSLLFKSSIIWDINFTICCEQHLIISIHRSYTLNILIILGYSKWLFHNVVCGLNSIFVILPRTFVVLRKAITSKSYSWYNLWQKSIKSSQKWY